MKKVGQYCNKEIRTYLRNNPHLTDIIVAEHFDVSTRVISANKAHITMGTDTDNPQIKAKSKKHFRTFKKQLTIFKTPTFSLVIDEDGQYHRCNLVKKTITKITDIQAKGIMISRLHDTYNN